ncbi:8855_t:CDS:2 [Rhizophagus irregularis]|nr:8855_t:CDS:2 [Rhizophagus irregularis]
MSTGKNISVKVTGEDGRSSLLRLNIEDKLEIIRKILEEDEKIIMNDKLSFLWSTDSSDIKDAKKVTRGEESDLILKDIIKNNTLYLIPNPTTKKNIRAKVAGEDGRSSLLRLNIEDKLEIIRKILEEDEKIRMNDKLSFLWSTDSSDIKDAKKVTRDEESDTILKDIIKNNTLCLIPDLTKKNIRVKVVGDDNRSLLLRLNIGDKLERIRKILEEDENIKMDNKLSFSRSINYSDVVTRNEESDLILVNIIKNNTLCLIPEKIRVKVVEDDDRISLLQLNIESKLEIIRKKLEEDENIKMDDNLLFSRSIDSSDIKDAKKVTRNEEFDLSLRDIIKNNNTLYLIKKDDYTDFKDRLKLGYGRILTPNKINIEISKEEVCTMEIIVLDNGGDKKVGDFSDFRTKKGWANKISMFFDGT